MEQMTGKKVTEEMNLLIDSIDQEVATLKEAPFGGSATYFCPETNHPLYTIHEESIELLHSFGTCKKCGIEVAKEALQFPMGMSDKWPVIYVGKYCLKCWKEPLLKKNPRKKPN